MPRRVLHVLNSPSGGAALSTIALIESLRGFGIESCAACHAAGTTLEREHLREAVRGNVVFTRLYWWNRKIRAPRWKRPLIELRQLLATGWKHGSAAVVTRFAAEQQADLIHTNTILTPEGALASRTLGLPHVWHVRELVGPGHPFRLPIEGPRLGRFFAQQCERLIANSHVTAAALEPWLPADLLAVVPNGIDLGQFARTHRVNQPGRPLVAAMVGNLTSRWKNHLLFVRAAAAVDRALPIEFRIYGHDPSEGGKIGGDDYIGAILAEIDRCGLRERFRLVGFRDNPAEIMSEIDILVHSAQSESFGRTIVEAMAARLPVVGVASGGVGELVRHEETGLLAEPDQPQQMAAFIERLARDGNLRHTFGSAGRLRAESLYSLESCSRRIAEIYADVCQSRANSAVTTSAGRPG